jgi:hypothetical protein
MQLAPTEHWNRAREYEAAGAIQQARTEYEAILATEPLHVPACLRMSRMEQLADRYTSSRDHALRAAKGVRITQARATSPT